MRIRRLTCALCSSTLIFVGCTRDTARATRAQLPMAAISGDVTGSVPMAALVPDLRVSPALDLPDVCASTGSIEATLRPANLLFVIDRSGSMNCNLPPITSSAECEQLAQKSLADQPSKWEIVRAELEAAFAQLPDTASAGISYFSNDDMCGVQSRPHVPMQSLEAEQIASLRDSLDNATPRGGTPIVGSLILAFKHLNPDQNPDQPFGNRFVVLLTDGQEGCAPEAIDRLLTVELPKAQQAGISTFVIGVPGSEPSRGFLSRLAFAGGTPASATCDHESRDPSQGDCHFDMTRDGDLSGALARTLSAISGRALSCELDVPSAERTGPIDYDKVNIVYVERTGEPEQLIPQDAAFPCSQGADGWQYSADKTKISICGPACERVRRAASIRLALGCKTVVPD